ncbi:aminopeptidase P family protein [Aquibium carbonis]|uniref:Aminopeptidase P family protein n=1 Tax=Aquibium carbonis TaxID=2495581 RepID=A0A3S0A7G0_9HYPH|nr:aminopeptidase P family protein [Aquibium carbonis]RST86433.1 aminopeptidase P family protein [Aquibium carbonis]
MFQSFDTVSDPSLSGPRVARLRAWLAGQGLDGFLVPRADEHQGEYVPARAERLQWITGFTGSAGVALILADRAHLFVDGRYTLQAAQQADPAIFTGESLIETPPPAFIRESLPEGLSIGFDPWLHTIGDAAALKSAVEASGGRLVALDRNAVDAVWDDQPSPPIEPVDIHPEHFAGRLAMEKLADLAESVAKADADCCVLTDPASLAWAFNIRGNDVPHTPLALGFAILRAEGLPLLFMDERKLPMRTQAYLTQLAELMPPSALEDEIVRLAASGARVGLDTALAAEKLRMLVDENGGIIVSMPDPVRLPRATKNAAELAGTRAAHRRDGVAVTRYLAWLDRQRPGSVDEIGAVTALENARRKAGEEAQMPLRDISFDTISGAGPNGAIIHYRVTTATNRVLGDGELFLVDSGAQFQDGTTDITRTVPIGIPSAEMRERYTLVLKGMIGISLLRFPAGTRGADIDAVARMALWKAGLDYGHGTGHGVGSYLSVHEGPQRIAKTGTEKLLPGMILSNEPGYYKAGHYGIRLENLIVVTEPQTIPGGDKPMHGFETLTLAPFDRRLIVTEMLTAEERAWVDAYHARVVAEIGPMLGDEDRAWLEGMAQPL